MGRVDRFGPEQLQRALVLTFDNLGEASALERGEQAAPTGRDPSVTEVLPRLLDELDRHELKATFFVEAINCELYPDAIAGIAARGHELGHHGWSHEQWDRLSPEAEREALTRGLRAFEQIGVRPRGFRPPGGALTDRTPALLRELGFEWCSPQGRDPHVEGELAYIPFDWGLVDAYYLMESFGSLRREHGDIETGRSAGQTAELIAGRLHRSTGLQTVILHPFLMLDLDWASGVEHVLSRVEASRRRRRTWVVPGGVFADWLRVALEEH